MKGKRILLAVSDRTFLSDLTAHLVAEDYDVAAAVDALQAMESVRRQVPDIVVADLDLPGGGASHLREQLQKVGHLAVPIVFLTDGSREAADRARRQRAWSPVSCTSPFESILSLVQGLLTDPVGRSHAVRRGDTLHVLAIEDDPDQQALIRSCLEAIGRESIEVTFAASLAAAEALIRQCKYSCVLLDDHLPDGDGATMLDELESELMTTPVIALMESDDPRLAVRFFRAGCIDYFVKDEVLNADALRRRIAEAMARYHRRALATIIERRQIGNVIGESQEGLIALARTDRLMGICNRGVFEEYGPTYHAEMATQGRPYAACMIDVDHFKSYNDQYGHAAGDDALRTVAQVIGRTLRDADFLARYGGEELIALLDGVDHSAAASVADRLRRHVFEADLEHAGNPPFGRVTISIGVAVFDPDSAVGVRALVEQADAAMYRAKDEGRNCVVVSPLDAIPHRWSA